MQLKPNKIILEAKRDNTIYYNIDRLFVIYKLEIISICIREDFNNKTF